MSAHPTPIEKMTDACPPLIVIGDADTHKRLGGLTSEVGFAGAVVAVVSVDVPLELVSPAGVCVESPDGVDGAVPPSPDPDGEDVSPDAAALSPVAVVVGCSVAVDDVSVAGGWSEDDPAAVPDVPEVSAVELEDVSAAAVEDES